MIASARKILFAKALRRTTHAILLMPGCVDYVNGKTSGNACPLSRSIVSASKRWRPRQGRTSIAMLLHLIMHV
jgi:hypothetical protein